MQAIAQLAALFPSLPSSALAETLCKSNGDVQRAAEALLDDGVAKSPMDLLKAAQEGDTATVKALLLAGADVHRKDATGYDGQAESRLVCHSAGAAGPGQASAGGCRIAQ